MKSQVTKQIAILFLVLQVIALLIVQTGNVKGEAQRALRIVDATTGSAQINLGNATEPLPAGGLPFTVKVIIDGATTGIATWQVSITFDNNSLRCTNILVPSDDPSYVFVGKQQIVTTDFSDETQNGKYDPTHPSVVAASTLLFPDQAANVTSSATLCIMNFTAKRTGNFNLSFFGFEDPFTSTFLLDSNYVPLPKESNQPYIVQSFSLSVAGAVSEPIADFAFSPFNPNANQTVTFDASMSYDPGGEDIQTYHWDFGDNTTITTNQSSSTHTYSQYGLYLVNLTVFNTDNLNGSTSEQLSVGSVPIVIFTYEPSIGVILPGDEVTFNSSQTSVANSTIVNYTWDFGDNVTVKSNETIATHKYSKRGVFTINLTVEDNYGLFNSTSTILQIGKPPTPLFTWDPEFPTAGDNVTFTASGTPDTGVSIANYTWDFGELPGVPGTAVTTTEPVIIKTYIAGGNFTVLLTILDSDGLYSSYNQTVIVESIAGLQKPVDYTVQIVFVVIIVLIAVALVIRRLRRKQEEALDI
jgi:PKD repeat protein